MEKTTTKDLKIKYVTGDATRPEGSGTKVIVHVNNAQGGWGAGFVLALSHRWLAPEGEYHKARKLLKLGMIQPVQVEDDIWVVNMVAQNLFPSGADDIPLVYDALEKCLNDVSTFVQLDKTNTTTIHMPRIGAGLAGGSWTRIEKLINSTLIDKGIPVIVYDLPTKSPSPGKSLHFKK